MENEVTSARIIEGLHPIDHARRRLYNRSARVLLASEQLPNANIIRADPKRKDRLVYVSGNRSICNFGEIRWKLAFENGRVDSRGELVGACCTSGGLREKGKVGIVCDIDGPCGAAISCKDDIRVRVAESNNVLDLSWGGSHTLLERKADGSEEDRKSGEESHLAG